MGMGDSSPAIVGLDPFDALLGSRTPAFVRRHARLRQVAVQARKRLPFDISGVLGIQSFAMSKTVGAYLAAAARVGDKACLHTLVHTLGSTRGALGEGRYGYEFDVQTRWAFYPAGSPNLIATVFVARGLGAAGIVMENGTLGGEMAASARFLREDLHSVAGSPYFMYTLTSGRLIHNANLLGAGLVAMDAALRGDSHSLELASASAMSTVRAQRDNGSWAYGEGSSLGWSDNFHTAYNLDGLLQVWLASGNPEVRVSLDRGVEHWMRDFFGPEGQPRYYPGKPYPYDIHSAGTAVDVAARLATWGWDTGALAERVADWAARNLIDPVTGVTYYQRHRFWTDKRHFVRWGDAHWALGTSSLRLLRESRHDPLEACVAAASGTVPDAS